jgi:hypothetical protein
LQSRQKALADLQQMQTVHVSYKCIFYVWSSYPPVSKFYVMSCMCQYVTLTTDRTFLVLVNFYCLEYVWQLSGIMKYDIANLNSLLPYFKLFGCLKKIKLFVIQLFRLNLGNIFGYITKLSKISRWSLGPFHHCLQRQICFFHFNFFVSFIILWLFYCQASDILVSFISMIQ